MELQAVLGAKSSPVSFASLNMCRFRSICRHSSHGSPRTYAFVAEISWSWISRLKQTLWPKSIEVQTHQCICVDLFPCDEEGGIKTSVIESLSVWLYGCSNGRTRVGEGLGRKASCALSLSEGPVSYSSCDSQHPEWRMPHLSHLSTLPFFAVTVKQGWAMQTYFPHPLTSMGDP